VVGVEVGVVVEVEVVVVNGAQSQNTEGDTRPI
jgi:hypothetical protein